MATTPTADCVVVGGGLAGMSAAHRLAAAGHRVVVLEAEDRLGGRAATSHIEGAAVDRGFQSLFGAYPETRDLMAAIGVADAELCPLRRGAVFHDGDGWARLDGAAAAVRRFPSLTAGDAVRLARLAAEVRVRSPESLLAGPEQRTGTAEYLDGRGFSAGAVEGLFRPLFGVITLDRELGADAAYFRFLLSMMVRGPAVLPADGPGMIAERAADDVRRRGGEVRTGARVEAVLLGGETGRVGGVRLAGGERVAARSVVLAVPAPAARALLGPHDPRAAARVPGAPAGAATLAYLMDMPLYRGRTIVLNSAPAGPEPRVDLVCQTTNVTRPGGPGPHVLLAMSVTTGGDPEPDRDAMERAVEATVARWAPRFPWRRHARAVELAVHPFAQFRVTPGVRASLPGARTRIEGLALAGDLTEHPSIEGAVVSGRKAAEVVAEALAPAD